MAEDTQEDTNQEQKFLLQYIIKNHDFILQNDTIGQFLKMNKNSIELDISEAADVYSQKDIFDNTYKVVNEELNEISNIKGFINRLLECKLCLLICKNLGETESVERIFSGYELQTAEIGCRGYFQRILLSKLSFRFS